MLRRWLGGAIVATDESVMICEDDTSGSFKVHIWSLLAHLGRKKCFHDLSDSFLDGYFKGHF